MLFTEFNLILASLVSLLEYATDVCHCTAFPLEDYHPHQTTQ